MADGLLDVSSDRAWRECRGRLADRIAALTEPDDQLRLEVPFVLQEEPDGCSPFVEFVGAGNDRVRAELPGNGKLDSDCAMSPDDVTLLLGHDWTEVREEERFVVEADVREADRVAVLAVQVLGEVFDVIHPSFLEGADEGCSSALEVAPQVADGEEVQDVEAPDRPQVIQFPHSRADIQMMVDATLAWHLGHAPEKDDDGDIAVLTERSVVHVRCPPEPEVVVFAPPVDGLTETGAALFEVDVLNRDHPELQSYLQDQRIVARRRVTVVPFVARHLREAIGSTGREGDRIAGDLVRHLGGHRFLEDPPAADAGPAWPLAGDVLTMVQLEADTPGSLDADLAPASSRWIARSCSPRSLRTRLRSWSGRPAPRWPSSPSTTTSRCTRPSWRRNGGGTAGAPAAADAGAPDLPGRRPEPGARRAGHPVR